MSEETKLQSISLELDSMTYRGGKEGGKPYFLIHHVSQGIYCTCSFFKCTVLPFFGQTRSHFIPGLSSVEAAAINSILQLKYFLFFFSYSLPFCIPSLPPQAAKGSSHWHRTSQLLKGEQQIWPAGSIKMITPPSSGQIQLNRHCTSMTRKVSCFLNSRFCTAFYKK